MSSSIRQSKLFAGEDFVSLYKSFQDINFTAYDYESIRDALIRNVQLKYPENFNDYIESSEFIAIIETLSYLGTSLAFRTDLNARENIMDTAQRRQSIIRLARMINYAPKRNIAANGLFKINSVQTNEPIRDSGGNQLNGLTITWNDQNNDDWFEQFISIINAALNPTNQFGRPVKSGDVSGVSTDLYTLNNQLGVDVVFPVSTTVNGINTPIDIVNVDFDQIIYEKLPDPNEGFNVLYRNDRNGMSSPDTGMFMYFKQGTLQKSDFQYDFPIPNRVEEINISNINNTDVYVQEIDDEGNVVSQWEKVPSIYGNNIIYNTINFNNRNIYEVVSGENDTISIKFGDGNFANSPTGFIRVWYRVSTQSNLTIRPDDIGDLQIRVPYIGKDGQRYGLVLSVGLEYTVNNGSPSETNEQVKVRAPQVYYSQDRMINNQDYNVFPLTRSNEIKKLKAVNRRFAGHTRLDDNDPTGFNKGLTIFGEDGALYNKPSDAREIVNFDSLITGDIASVTYAKLSEFIKQRDINNFFINSYLPKLSQEQFKFSDTNGFWKTSPNKVYGSLGMIVNNDTESTEDWPIDNAISTTSGPYRFIKSGSVLSFTDDSRDGVFSTSVRRVSSDGIPPEPQISNKGNIALGSQVKDLSKLIRVVPTFRTSFNDEEMSAILDNLRAYETFYIKYDVVDDMWTTSTDGIIDSDYDINSELSNWFVAVKFVPQSSNNPPYFEMISRGIDTIFESYSNVKFYWDGNEVVDGKINQSFRDSITILSDVNYSSSREKLQEDIVFEISGNYIQSDGYIDDNKVIVNPIDRNEDGASDEPYVFTDLVSKSDEVILENFVDSYGYERTRPWYSRWTDLTQYLIDDIDDIEITFDPDLITFKTDPDIQVNLREFDLLCVSSMDIIQLIISKANLLHQDPRTRVQISNFIEIFSKKSITLGVPNKRDGENTEFYNFTYDDFDFIIHEIDPRHLSRNGRSFGLNKNDIEVRDSLYYKWNHYVSGDQIVDPSPSNVINMIVLTNTYYDEMMIWKRSGANTSKPKSPTTDFLKSNFAELDSYKSISDELIFNSCKFKILFGNGASDELKAKFKAIKLPNSTISNNELKTGIIKAIDKYFDVSNWDFGESFYFTELAAYIHSQMSKHLSTVVIVPEVRDSEFGDLFEITCKPDELFFSTATIDNIDIVSNFNNNNLRM